MINEIESELCDDNISGDTELHNSLFGIEKKYNMTFIRWSVVGERTLWMTGLDELEMDEW